MCTFYFSFTDIQTKETHGCLSGSSSNAKLQSLLYKKRLVTNQKVSPMIRKQRAKGRMGCPIRLFLISKIEGKFQTVLKQYRRSRKIHKSSCAPFQKVGSRNHSRIWRSIWRVVHCPVRGKYFEGDMHAFFKGFQKFCLFFDTPRIASQQVTCKMILIKIDLLYFMFYLWAQSSNFLAKLWKITNSQNVFPELWGWIKY